jgi:glutamine synthetase
MELNDLADKLKEEKINIIHVGQFDHAGIFRERRMPRDSFLEWASQPRFSNTVAIWDSADNLFGPGPYLTEDVAIDAASLRSYPFEPDAAAIIAEFSGSSAEIMPRAVLRRQVERAAALGLDVRAAFEFEVIFLDETAESLRAARFAGLRSFAPDNKCWGGQTGANHAGFVAGLEDTLRATGISVFGVSGELGPGCFEATLAAESPLKAADDAGFFRLATRAYARNHGKTASFMSCLGQGYPGLGGHVSVSLWDKATGRNIFSDPQSVTSQAALNFIGGMTRTVPEAFVLCAHTVNAYRRYAPGSWAPKSVGWAELTFTTAVRSVPSQGSGARLEFRLPGADCNPYLALALMLGAGLDGIEEKLPAPAPTPDAGPDDILPGAIRLPVSLADAAARLSESENARRLFGERFVNHFTRACEIEHASLARAVSAQEIERYLEG